MLMAEKMPCAVPGVTAKGGGIQAKTKGQKVLETETGEKKSAAR